jgi:hypothetical protein
MIGNLEKEFLSKDDYGVLLPKSWARGTSKFFKIEIWWIIFFLFTIVSVISIYLLYKQLSYEQLNYVLITQILGWLIVFVYVLQSHAGHLNFTGGAQGKTIALDI